MQIQLLFASKEVLLCMNLRIQDAHGQCNDGCSTITRTKNGFAAQVKKLNEKCLLTHCYCHSFNLAVRDTIKNIALLKDMACEISKLIKKRVLKERQNSTGKKRISGTNEVISMYMIWTHQL